MTHDTGSRLAWNLRPVVSLHQTDFQDRRDNMADVCNQCHAEGWVSGYFAQFDRFHRDLQPEVRPARAKDHERALRRQGPDADPFDEPIEFTFYELWHHEGRRARHGAAMMAPDFVQWQGM